MKTTITLNTITTSIATAMALNESFTKALSSTSKQVTKMQNVGKTLLLGNVAIFHDLIKVRPTMEIPTLLEDESNEIEVLRAENAHAKWSKAYQDFLNTFIIADDFDAPVSTQAKKLLGAFGEYMKDIDFWESVTDTVAYKGFTFTAFTEFESLNSALQKIVKKEAIDKKGILGEDVWTIANLTTDKKNEKFLVEWDKVTNPEMMERKNNAARGDYESVNVKNIADAEFKKDVAKKKEELGLSAKDSLPQDLYNKMYVESVLTAQVIADENVKANEAKREQLATDGAKKGSKDLEDDLK